jgi:hypothetical protein
MLATVLTELLHLLALYLRTFFFFAGAQIDENITVQDEF